jgi:hypothetical protein
LPTNLAEVADALREGRPPTVDHGALGAIVDGWAAYFRGDLPHAGARFHHAWEADEGWGSWAALGLGKVATDLGRWGLARSWLLHAMALARADMDVSRLAAASGALAEVCCRAADMAGAPGPDTPAAALLRAAHELLELDAALLPVGSLDRRRVENYRAVCLGRLGAYRLTPGSAGRELRALREAHARMWSSHHAAEGVDPVSADYALASLFMLSMRIADRRLYRHARARAGARAQATGEPSLAGPDRYPLGVIQAVRAFWRWRDGQLPDAIARLEAAHEAFGPDAPLEQLALVALQARLRGAPAPDEAIAALRARPAPPGPGSPRVAAVDGPLAKLVLPDDECPFPWLSAPDVDGLWAGFAQAFV